MSDITERLEFLAARAQTKTSREFYRSVKAENKRLRLALDMTEGELKNATIEIERLQATASIAAPFGRLEGNRA